VLLLVAVAVQFYFAAVGAFSKPQTDGSYRLHEVTGMMVIPLLSILATAAAALSRAPGRLIGLAIAPLGLVVVQVLIVLLGKALNDDSGNTTTGSLVILGLHAINGGLVMMVAALNLRGARALVSARPDSTDHAVAA
jgi:hypothetical protein